MHAKCNSLCHGRETREQNTLVRVNQDGKAKVAAFLSVPKNFQSDAVATCGARGPDGQRVDLRL